MSFHRILNIILSLIGQGLLIAGFVMFGGGLSSDVLTLDIIISSIIYWCVVYNLSVPILELSDKSQRAVGSLGIHWTTFWLYSLAAIAMMVAGIYFAFSLKYQIFVQLGLLFLFVIGIAAGWRAGDKVSEVYHIEKTKQFGVKTMRSAVEDALETARSEKEVPGHILNGLEELQRSLNYISPNSDSEASALEAQFVEQIGDLKRCLTDYDMNKEQCLAFLEKAGRTLARRKAYMS